MIRNTLTYQRIEYADLGEDDIKAAFDASGPDVLLVRNVIAAPVLAACLTEVAEHAVPYRSPRSELSAPPILRVGESMYESAEDLDDFFGRSSAAAADLARDFPITDMVAEVLVQRIARRWSAGEVAVGVEPGRGRHRPWIVRSMPSGTGPHRDSTTEEAPGLSLARPGEERALNLYLENDAAGGQLIVYAVQPRTGEPAAYRSGTDRFEESIYSSAAHLTVPVEPGDVTIFDPSLIHAVAAPKGRRVSLSFFVKRIENNLFLRT